METAENISAGLMDDGYSLFVPGVNCLECGRFVGRDGWIGIGTFEMSGEVAYVEGECGACCAKRPPASSIGKRNDAR